MDLVINIILNNLDIFMIYNLFFRLMNREMKINRKDIIIGLLWGTVNGIFVNYADLSSFKFLLYMSVYFYIWSLCRKKIYETLIINIISNFFMIVVVMVKRFCNITI